jgi:hypothetical protein
LTPASGRQDHTPSPSASVPFVIGTSASTASPRVRDDREPPLQWDETAEDIQLIWVFGKSEYFFERGWTLGAIDCPGDLPDGQITWEGEAR